MQITASGEQPWEGTPGRAAADLTTISVPGELPYTNLATIAHGSETLPWVEKSPHYSILACTRLSAPKQNNSTAMSITVMETSMAAKYLCIPRPQHLLSQWQLHGDYRLRRCWILGTKNPKLGICVRKRLHWLVARASQSLIDNLPGNSRKRVLWWSWGTLLSERQVPTSHWWPSIRTL